MLLFNFFTELGMQIWKYLRATPGCQSALFDSLHRRRLSRGSCVPNLRRQQSWQTGRACSPCRIDGRRQMVGNGPASFGRQSWGPKNGSGRIFQARSINFPTCWDHSCSRIRLFLFWQSILEKRKNGLVLVFHKKILQQNKMLGTTKKKNQNPRNNSECQQKKNQSVLECLSKNSAFQETIRNVTKKYSKPKKKIRKSEKNFEKLRKIKER